MYGIRNECKRNMLTNSVDMPFVTSSKALVTTSKALVTSSDAPVTTSVALVTTNAIGRY